MTEFSTTGTLNLQASSSSLKSARKTIESELSGTTIDVQTSGTGSSSMVADGGRGGSLASGIGGGALASSMTESVDLATERNTLLYDIRDYTERGAMSGGDGGGGGMLSSLLPIGAFSALSGGLSSILGTTSLGALVKSVSMRSLITRIPAFATLVTAADLGTDLVTGELTADDLVSAPIELGDQLTFGMLDSKLIESAIGTVTLAFGTYQIGSLIAGKLGGSALASYFGSTGISTMLSGKLGGSTLASYFGSTSMSGMLSGIGGGSSLSGLLGSVGLGTILTGLGTGALAGLLGTVAITEILSGGKVNFSWGGADPENTTDVDPGASGTATGWNPTGTSNFVETYNENNPADDEKSAREKFAEMSAAERQEAMENQSWTMTASVEDNNSTPSDGNSSNSSGSSGSKDNSGDSSKKNRASEKSRQQPEINYSPTFKVDLSKLEGKIDKDLRELERKVDDLENRLNSIGGVR